MQFLWQIRCHDHQSCSKESLALSYTYKDEHKLTSNDLYVTFDLILSKSVKHCYFFCKFGAVITKLGHKNHCLRFRYGVFMYGSKVTQRSQEVIL